MMPNFYRHIRVMTKRKIVRPIFHSYTPVNELSWGIAVGIFWLFTPLLGVQMYAVLICWLLSKFLFKFHFDIAVSMALVWISNPLTAFFLYYAFYITGYYVLMLADYPVVYMSFGQFQDNLSEILTRDDLGYLDSIILATEYLLTQLGMPIILGSFSGGVFFGVLGYFAGRWLIVRSRKKKAANQNMTYREWRYKYEKRRDLKSRSPA